MPKNCKDVLKFFEVWISFKSLYLYLGRELRKGEEGSERVMM